MTYLSVKNWEKYQHYKHRNPPWIRLYTDLLDEYQHDGEPNTWRRLPDASAVLACCLWMLAGRFENRIPYNEAWIEKQTGRKCGKHLKVLIDMRFISICEHTASGALAGCKQDASPETETETETETESVSLEPENPASKPPNKIYLTFPCVGDPQTWNLTRTQLNAWWKVYRGRLDVLAECKRAHVWCEANPQRRKTARGMPRFLVNWLNRAVDSGHGIPADVERENEILRRRRTVKCDSEPSSVGDVLADMGIGEAKPDVTQSLRDEEP